MTSGINGVTSAGGNQAAYINTAAQTEAGQEETASATLPVDKVELGSSGTESSAKTYKPDTKMINYLNNVTQNNLNTLKSMVDKLLSGQSSTASGMWSKSYNSISSLRTGDFSVFYQSQQTYSFQFGGSVSSADDVQAQAQALIAEDGPLGIKAVSENILNFAKAISGGDSSKIDMLKDAVQKGFDQVAGLFGGWSKLPDITHDTYDAVMAGFDAWQNGDSAYA